MIIRTLAETINGSNHARGLGWESRRLLVRSDDLGFSLHDTLIAEGTEQRLEYKHHIEANYCLAGEGEVVNLSTGEKHTIVPGTLYALDQHDAHILRATRGELRLVCVFRPALIGTEVHDLDGSYPAPKVIG